MEEQELKYRGPRGGTKNWMVRNQELDCQNPGTCSISQESQNQSYGVSIFPSVLFSLSSLCADWFLISLSTSPYFPFSRPFHTPAFPQKVLFSFPMSGAVFLGEELNLLNLNCLVSTPDPIICDQGMRLITQYKPGPS